MSDIRRTSASQAIAQVNTVTPANVLATNTFTITINNKSVTFTATLTTVAHVTAGLVVLCDAAKSTIPEFNLLTFTDSTTCVTITGPAGVYFVQTSSATGGTATNVTATTTAASGPSFWTGTANWSGGSNPVDTDNVTLDNSIVNIRYDLGQSSIEPTSLTYAASFTGDIGLPKQNENGYVEYLPDYLTIGAALVRVGVGEGNGSGRIKHDAGTDVVAVEVIKTGSPIESGLGAFIFKGTHASNTMEVREGTVDVAPFGGETAVLATLLNTAGTVRCGTGVTLTTVKSGGGSIELQSNVTTLTVLGGEGRIRHAATVTTLVVENARFFYDSSGTCTSATIKDGGFLDLSGDISPVTFTDLTLNGGEVYDPYNRLTVTNGITRGTSTKRIVSQLA